MHTFRNCLVLRVIYVLIVNVVFQVIQDRFMHTEYYASIPSSYSFLDLSVIFHSKIIIQLNLCINSKFFNVNTFIILNSVPTLFRNVSRRQEGVDEGVAIPVLFRN